MSCDGLPLSGWPQHKARDVYTKACGAASLWPSHVVKTTDGLFAGVKCDEDTTPPAAAVAACTAGSDPAAASRSCASRFYKIADESNGLATSCPAVDQKLDPVRGLSLAGCQAACDALGGCNTVNYRVTDPNFDGDSTCYRKACGSFKAAVCTLFSQVVHAGNQLRWLARWVGDMCMIAFRGARLQTRACQQGPGACPARI